MIGEMAKTYLSGLGLTNKPRINLEGFGFSSHGGSAITCTSLRLVRLVIPHQQDESTLEHASIAPLSPSNQRHASSSNHHRE